MNLDAFRQHCLAKSDVTEEFPFDKQTVVFKVKGKMFVLADIHDFDSINVKCDPDEAVRLREEYECVRPGYHMNKKHWNTILFDGSVTDRRIFEWIDESYRLVVSKIPGHRK